MTGTFENFSGPNYISSHSADAILSDVRPIKLKLEALRAINVLLDEFLYNILNAAGSVSTNRIKTGLIRILPTSLGKEAVLEAELELKAYWERSSPSSPKNTTETAGEFDLQWSFELLRLKCEAYSTMNDTDEDIDAERRLNDRMANSGGTFPPKQHLLAPAALYLTAIIEYVCEHILSNVSRVAARDSSRTLAAPHDLFVALCEDETAYGMFKTMKVYEQIENLSRVQKPRRSKSFSRSIDRGSPAPRAATPTNGESGSVRETGASPAKVRASSESSSTITSPKSVAEKSRKIFGRSSSDNTERPSVEINRVQNGGSPNGNSLDLMDDSASLQDEFDELMRSGTTMKVSLTPDRLRTMEVYKQGRQRNLMRDDAVSTPGEQPTRGNPTRRPSARNVDAIVEDDEDMSSPTLSPPANYATSSPANILANSRQRLGSLTHANSINSGSAASNARVRSVSVGAAQHPKKKPSLGDFPPPPPLPSNAIPLQMHRALSVNQGGFKDGRPQRTRKVVRNRESLDLDEVMAGSDDEVDIPSTPATVKSTGGGSVAGTPRKPHISKAARELIDFLDEGPPADEPKFNPVNASMISFESSMSKNKTSGRLKQMISRLAIGGSRENLQTPIRSMENGRMMGHRLNSSASPPPAYLQSSLSGKRSMPNVVIATPPPPRPPAPPVPRPITPPSSSHPSAEDISSNSNSLTPSRRLSIARKAVPTLDDKTVSSTLSPPASSHDEFEIRPPPRSSSNGAVLRPVNGNGHHSKAVPIKENGDVNNSHSVRHKASLTATSVSSHASSIISENVAILPTPTPVVLNGNSFRRPSPSPSSTPIANSYMTSSVSTPTVKTPEKQVTTESKEISTVGGPFLSIEDMQNLRRLLSVATTADECRLLVDMFLAKNGCPPMFDASPSPQRSQRPSSQSRRPDEVSSEIQTKNEELERGLVSLLLGEEEDDTLLKSLERSTTSIPRAVKSSA
ncbi:hypothetical protein C8Q75DRAFT_373065 [Abortiporus biennis]|nr:hypothetical protein C8Q75DRAFT_373065 [Abortiporus biennis]